jgi:hypothetical protein
MASIKLKHASGNSTILNSPAANPSSDITLKLPSTTGSAGQVLQVASANHSSTNAELEFAAAASGGGITVAQTFRRTTFTATNDQTTYFGDSNWEKSDGELQGGFGSFADPTNGVFTFPVTGYYYIEFQSYYEDTGFSRNNQLQILATSDNNNYSIISAVNFGNDYDVSSYAYQSASTRTIIDVTDLTNQKVIFGAYSISTVSWDASSTQDRTAATFIRLGDT